MIEEKINTKTAVQVELGMLGAVQADWLSIHKTPMQFAFLAGGRRFTCYAKETDFGPVLQFGRLLIPCHVIQHDDEGNRNRLIVTVSAFDAGRMISYAASRGWQWRGGSPQVCVEYRADNGYNIASALKAALA